MERIGGLWSAQGLRAWTAVDKNMKTGQYKVRGAVYFLIDNIAENKGKDSDWVQENIIATQFKIVQGWQLPEGSRATPGGPPTLLLKHDKDKSTRTRAAIELKVKTSKGQEKTLSQIYNYDCIVKVFGTEFHIKRPPREMMPSTKELQAKKAAQDMAYQRKVAGQKALEWARAVAAASTERKAATEHITDADLASIVEAMAGAEAEAGAGAQAVPGADMVTDADAALFGGPGADMVTDADAALFGGPGADMVTDADAALFGGAGADMVTDADAALFGGAGADMVTDADAALFGGAGVESGYTLDLAFPGEVLHAPKPTLSTIEAFYKGQQPLILKEYKLLQALDDVLRHNQNYLQLDRDIFAGTEHAMQLSWKIVENGYLHLTSRTPLVDHERNTQEFNTQLDKLIASLSKTHLNAHDELRNALQNIHDALKAMRGANDRELPTLLSSAYESVGTILGTHKRNLYIDLPDKDSKKAKVSQVSLCKALRTLRF
jgi:hypothetical protein